MGYIHIILFSDEVVNYWIDFQTSWRVCREMLGGSEWNYMTWKKYIRTEWTLIMTDLPAKEAWSQYVLFLSICLFISCCVSHFICFVHYVLSLITLHCQTSGNLGILPTLCYVQSPRSLQVIVKILKRSFYHCFCISLRLICSNIAH